MAGRGGCSTHGMLATWGSGTATVPPGLVNPDNPPCLNKPRLHLALASGGHRHKAALGPRPPARQPCRRQPGAVPVQRGSCPVQLPLAWHVRVLEPRSWKPGSQVK